MPVDSETEAWIRQRAAALTGDAPPAHPRVWDDTTNCMSIERGDIVRLGGEHFLVRSNEHEGRFGIDDQPKFWVKRALSLETGRAVELKLGCEEQFKVHIGDREIRCYRSPAKEAAVLDLVREDGRFMQGKSVTDAAGNLVRIIDFVRGTDLLSYIESLPLRHEAYCRTLLPGILARVADSLGAIGQLHDAGLCHGDIRNDHLLIERETGLYKWIDFDLTQDSPEFDIWSAGNILHCVCAKGFLTFHDALRIRPELSGRLLDADASVFFPNRVMNLRKVYGYLPARLNDVLCRFSFGALAPYASIRRISADLAECAKRMEP